MSVDSFAGQTYVLFATFLDISVSRFSLLYSSRLQIPIFLCDDDMPGMRDVSHFKCELVARDSLFSLFSSFLLSYLLPMFPSLDKAEFLPMGVISECQTHIVSRWTCCDNPIYFLFEIILF